METFTMSRKELPRAGLVQAALAGKITNREGARALHLSVRHFQRLKRRVREGGLLALRHQSRGRPSRRRLPAAVAGQVQVLLRDRYAGFNDTHLTEKLREVHHLPVSRESVRRLRIALGWPAVHRRRPARHRTRRPRAAAAGQLLQLDGSPFAWLEDRGPVLTLLGAIDDATSEVLALHFRPTEDLHGYATLLQQVFTTYGLPVALYGDGISILVRSDAHWTLPEQLAGQQEPTHLGRVLTHLGIGYVRAHSPQAKGRVERLWATLQDRLVSELRLRQIPTPAAANAFLPSFLADFNRRFTRPPAAPPVWRRPPPDLDLHLGCRYQRVVARDNTLRVGARLVLIPPGPRRRSFARCRVEVRELLDGRLVVFYQDQIIARQAPPPGDFVLAPRRAPHAERRPRRARRGPSGALRVALAELAASTPAAPARGHPWRYPFSRRAPFRGPASGRG
jgi:transposase